MNNSESTLNVNDSNSNQNENLIQNNEESNEKKSSNNKSQNQEPLFFSKNSKKHLIIFGIGLLVMINIAVGLFLLINKGIIGNKKKRIFLIATGGTIASTKKEGHLTPTIDINDLLSKIPNLKSVCTIEGEQIFSKDSTNIQYSDWHKVALKIKEKYNDYDGFVITHGTDTMAYGSAIMSYFIQNSTKPIVFTGSQKSITEAITDAKRNLYDAFVVASHNKIHGVKLVFNGDIIDGFRAKKMMSKSFNAFYSIDVVPDKIVNGLVILKKEEQKVYEPVQFLLDYDDRVFLLKFIPGVNHTILQSLKDSYKVIILEGFGMGGVPNYSDNPDDKNKFVEEIKKIREQYHVEFIAASQIIYEGTHLGVYKVGNVDLMETQSMTIEATVAKSIWALGQCKGNMTLFRKIFETKFGYDRFKFK